MKYIQIKGCEIKGYLGLLISQNEYELIKCYKILIHGDYEGLISFAKLLIEKADLNQVQIDDKFLPIEAREHYTLRSKL